MPTLLELTAQIVSAHASNTQMTSDELFQSLHKVHASLKALETCSPIAIGTTMPAEVPKLTIKQAFKRDEVVCMICGQGFKTLKRHLAQAHGLKPGHYRKQFGIPSSTPLTARSYSESRRQSAIEGNLSENLAKARKVRAARVKANRVAVPAVKVKAPAPAVKAKASVLAVKVNAAVPAVRKKPAVPAKLVKNK